MTAIELPFALGELLWTPSYGGATRRITCPECAGTRAIEMIKGNGERLSLGCENCSSGWDAPRGWVEVDAWRSVPIPFMPRRVRVDGDEFSYSESPPEGSSYSSRSSKDLFRTKEECQARCEEIDAERERNNAESALRRVSNSRKKMSQHATWWTKRVKELERDLEMAKAKLARCKVKPDEKLTA